MGEVMSVAEIKAKFKDEWIVLDDPEPFDDREPLSGILVFHGTDGDQAWREAKRQNLRRFAVFFNGPALPPGVGACL